ncbi:hypothetical protein KC343_g437 [Hortaea werneckii]|uniref:Uncharacterized protein n=1 Tax=Hortaea werneckii TaxID=91943 RepID=A0A3M7HGH6_HORWE|nr:hypothetical protein KC352_g13697 [Hortaea werneckii]KAI7571656.1 hypothetical protein KC317_g1446 [Hortaea werneckii]KAI7622972.1 hypothetical protein KC346_g2958 [Hortaea werneckii]KAI7637929.1 hypothetical protein KC343_g437 [Hortaea werneckii]KAI7677731.1 hypothetical protein KC319_g3730 [Hortaea werneckii]
MTSRLSYGRAHEQAMTDNGSPSTTLEKTSLITSTTGSLNGISSESAGSTVQTNTLLNTDTTLRSATKLSTTVAATNSRPTALGVNALSQTNPSISWGHDITASLYHIPTSTQRETNAGGPTATQDAAFTSSPRASDGEATGGFSRSQKQLIIATTVIGGAFILALLVYSIYRRRKGATVSEIVRFRPHQPSTIQLSPRSSSQPRGTNKLNIYREERFSLHSSKHASLASRSKGPKTATYPAEATQRFHNLNPYVKNQWQTKYPVASEPVTPVREGHSFLIDASPEPSTRRGSEPPAKDPQNVRVQIKRKSDAGSHTAPSSKAGLTVSVNEASPSSTRQTDQMSLKTPRTYDTQASFDHDNDDRWSWTNSQAPPTPRIVAPNNRSSLSSSISKLRGIRSWVRGTPQADGRIDEEQGGGGGGVDRPGSSGSHHRPILKNQAAVPVLAPAPVATRFPGSKSSSSGGGGRSSVRLKGSRSGTARRSAAASLFRQASQQRILSPTTGGTADRPPPPPSPTPVSPGVVEEGALSRDRGVRAAAAGNAIEMAERGKGRR